ncbi:hypothetical protein [Dokdonella sp.]|uniref:hypothetical protein n=1 Tax=Dokdonella sp. TaxID=2291710 RepID=UPI0025C3BA3C|nr:hypothetical protein [Dokdonella sp.]MBX3690208.1 hypothetical protein [Dokdonella sp.]
MNDICRKVFAPWFRPPQILAALLACNFSLESFAGETSPRCYGAVSMFIQRADEKTLAELRAADPKECWIYFDLCDDRRGALQQRVAEGNRPAATYLASKLKLLGGGNLEDAMVALGEFSEKDMESFLAFARDHVLSPQVIADAVVMLPLETVDEPALQLGEIVKRRNAAAKVSEQSLQEYRRGVLAALDAAVLRIKKNYGE